MRERYPPYRSSVYWKELGSWERVLPFFSFPASSRDFAVSFMVFPRVLVLYRQRLALRQFLGFLHQALLFFDQTFFTLAILSRRLWGHFYFSISLRVCSFDSYTGICYFFRFSSASLIIFPATASFFSWKQEYIRKPKTHHTMRVRRQGWHIDLDDNVIGTSTFFFLPWFYVLVLSMIDDCKGFVKMELFFRNFPDYYFVPVKENRILAFFTLLCLWFFRSENKVEENPLLFDFRAIFHIMTT